MVIHIEFDIKITDHNGIVLQSTGNHYDKKVSYDGKQDTDTLIGIEFTDFLGEYLSSSGFFIREKLMKVYGSGKRKRQVRRKTIKEAAKPSEINDKSMPDLLNGSELEYKIRIGDNKYLIGKIPLKIDADSNTDMGSIVISASVVTDEAAIKADTKKVTSSDSDELVSTVSYYKAEDKDRLEASDRGEKYNRLESPDSDEEIRRYEEADSDEDIITLDASDDDGEINSLDASDDDGEINCLDASDDDEDSYSTEASSSDAGPDIYNLLSYSMMKAIEKYEDNIYSVWYEYTNNMEPTIDE